MDTLMRKAIIRQSTARGFDALMYAVYILPSSPASGNFFQPDNNSENDYNSTLKINRVNGNTNGKNALHAIIVYWH